MSITINGTGTITGISAGGLNDSIITQSELATGVAGTGPAFSVYKSASQTLSSATMTKITFNTEEFDTANCFASDKFTPNVAGYYQINGQVSNGSGTQTVASIYKNGTEHKVGTNANSFGAIVSAVIYLNGSSDYVELYGYFATGTTTGSGVASTWFNGSMIRSA